jgi:hypothetical protein
MKSEGPSRKSDYPNLSRHSRTMVNPVARPLFKPVAQNYADVNKVHLKAKRVFILL